MHVQSICKLTLTIDSDIYDLIHLHNLYKKTILDELNKLSNLNVIELFVCVN